MSATNEAHSEPVAGPVERPVRPASEARWYSVSRIGMAKLCLDEEDAKREAANDQQNFPNNGPYRAVLLGDVAAERERCIDIVARNGGSVEIEAEIRAASSGCETRFEVRVAGPDDVIWFGSELDAHRHANAINIIYLADREKHPESEVLCVATVHETHNVRGKP